MVIANNFGTSVRNLHGSSDHKSWSTHKSIFTLTFKKTEMGERRAPARHIMGYKHCRNHGFPLHPNMY